MIHGVFVDSRVWRPVLDYLAGRHRVVTVDLPGHGDLANLPFTLDVAATRVNEVIGSLDGPPPFLVGWSLGGYAALTLAAANQRSIAGLVLSGASVEPELFLRGPLRELMRGLGHVPDAVSEPVARAVALLACPAAVVETLDGSGLYMQRGFEALASLPSSGFEDRLAAFDGPVLILNGRRDLLVRRTQERFLAACRDGSLEVISGVGHLAPLQAPRRFAAAVDRFVGRVSKSKS